MIDEIKTSSNIHLNDLFPVSQKNGRNSIESLEVILKMLEMNQIPIRFNFEHIRFNGHIFPTEMTLILSENNEDEVIFMIKDLSHQKEQQQLINAQSEKLETKDAEIKKYTDSNNQLENFAYMAAHDLKSPIRTVLKFSEELQKAIYPKIDETEKELLNDIISVAKNMRILVSALLEYSLAETSKINIGQVELPLLIEEIKRDLKGEIESKKANIIIQDIPTSICADRFKLKQLFQNLISNALKFVAPDVEPQIKINAKNCDHFWEFSVTDNGIGIAKESQDKIFDLFRRLHTNRSYKGNGIGLAMCKTIVEQHQGKFTLESQLGIGSSFIFSLKKTNKR